MRITYLATSAALGGAETSLLDILASLRHAEPSWELALVTPAPGPLVERASGLGVRCDVMPFPDGLARTGESLASALTVRGTSAVAGYARLVPALVGGWRYARRLARHLAADRPDVVHANGVKMDLAAARALPKGARLVWHVHDYLGTRALTSRLMRRAAGVPALAIANSRSVAADVRAVCGGGLRVETIYNAVDLRRFSPDGRTVDLDALSGLARAPAGTVRIGLVATFARWKGHETFIDAVARLPAALPARAYIVGGPVYRTEGSQYRIEELRDLASRAGVAGRLGFTGLVDEPGAAMRALDIVVHASTEPEPFGMVIAEAMACGRAVVVSRAGGAIEIIDDGRDAVTCLPRDPAALADQLTALVGDAARRHRLGREARLTAERRFDRARYARELVPLYRSLAPAA